MIINQGRRERFQSFDGKSIHQEENVIHMEGLQDENYYDWTARPKIQSECLQTREQDQEVPTWNNGNPFSLIVGSHLKEGK